jgi:hypothetical protein
MILTKQIIGNELYVFNAWGHLIYKRWLNTGSSRLFHEGEGLTERSR